MGQPHLTQTQARAHSLLGSDPEAIKTKLLCDIGGLSFKNNENVKVLASIIGTGSTKKVLPCSPTKKLRKSKSVTGGASSRDSDNIPLASLVGAKSQRNPKSGNLGKKSKLPLTSPNLQGRNLSTRIMRLGSKSKLK
ncbi:hypothetical protein PIB30_081935 [Stylosanthes scabra]|uniref:Uncharacterized protein n=1 Tax=Stylosanthes scabra TaxID=79078 RepID=A0ABU6XQK6_9FABA|nr:hypothetical protein [Stylosanthes scabra]